MIKLIHGKDPFIIRRKSDELISNLQEDNKNLEYISLNAIENDYREIAQSYRSIDMFSQGKIILIKNFYKSKQRAELLEDLKIFYDENLGLIKDDSVNIICREEQKIRSNTRYYKFFKKYKAIVEIKKLNKRTFITWAKKLLKMEENNLESSLVYELAQIANYNTERFYSEIQKINLLDDQKIKELNKEKLNNLTTNTLEYEIWALLDSINKNPTRLNRDALEILERMFEQKVEPFYIMAMITRNVRLITQVKYLREVKHESNKKICSILKIPPFTLPPLIKKSKNYTDDKIKYLYEKLNNLDYEIKTGKIEPILGLTLLFTVL